MRCALPAIAIGILGGALASGAAAATFDAEDYFPLYDYTTWDYEVDGGPEQTTDTVAPLPVLINGVWTALVWGDDGQSQNWTNDDGIELHRISVNTSYGVAEVTLDPPVRLTDPIFQVGDQHQMVGGGEIVIANVSFGDIAYSFYSDVDRTKFLTVPMGTYAVVRIDFDLDVDVSALAVSITSSNSIWLADAMGPIRIDSSIGGDVTPSASSLALTAVQMPEPGPVLGALVAVGSVAACRRRRCAAGANSRSHR